MPLTPTSLTYTLHVFLDLSFCNLWSFLILITFFNLFFSFRPDGQVFQSQSEWKEISFRDFILWIWWPQLVIKRLRFQKKVELQKKNLLSTFLSLSTFPLYNVFLAEVNNHGSSHAFVALSSICDWRHLFNSQRANSRATELSTFQGLPCRSRWHYFWPSLSHACHWLSGSGWFLSQGEGVASDLDATRFPC